MKRRAEEQEADTGARGASSKFTATVVQPFNLSISKRKPVYIDEEPVRRELSKRRPNKFSGGEHFVVGLVRMRATNTAPQTPFYERK